MQETRFTNCFGEPKSVYPMKALPFLTKSAPDKIHGHNPTLRLHVGPYRFLLLEALSSFQIKHLPTHNKKWLVLHNGTEVKLDYDPDVLFEQIARSGYTLTQKEDIFVLTRTLPNPEPASESPPDPAP